MPGCDVDLRPWRFGGEVRLEEDSVLLLPEDHPVRAQSTQRAGSAIACPPSALLQHAGSATSRLVAGWQARLSGRAASWGGEERQRFFCDAEERRKVWRTRHAAAANSFRRRIAQRSASVQLRAALAVGVPPFLAPS